MSLLENIVNRVRENEPRKPDETIDQDWNTNGGLPIGPKAAWDRGRAG